MTNTLLIVDGNNLAHKARHVFHLTKPDGSDCSVIYGFIKVLWSYLNEFRPTSCIVCWDGGIPRHRREQSPAYKANRQRGDEIAYDDFRRQLVELHSVLEMMGVYSVRAAYVEADDLMYHAARLAHDNYTQVIVASSDKDMWQVVNIANNVFVYEPSKKFLIDAVKIVDLCGIPANWYVHWRALQGDSGDNISGAVGVGPVTATRLFNEFGSISAILNAANGSNPRGAIHGKLRDQINSFGLAGVTKNVMLMGLAFDRAGARHAMVDNLGNYRKANHATLKRYFFTNAFMSLMDAKLYSLLLSLNVPVFATNLRMPVVVHYRTPA